MAKNIKQPLVTVLMPVYNGEKSLREAIDSILSQTFKDFEFLIINDGSSDETESIIKSYKDERIRLINNPNNVGVSASMNKGIIISKGRYIARMDADDISKSTRFEAQINFLKKNKAIDVCGTWVETFGKKKVIWRFPINSQVIKISLLFTNTIANSSMMLKKDSIMKNKLSYNTGYLNLEDYELWSKGVPYLNFANIPVPLLRYRITEKHFNKDKLNKEDKLWKKIVAFQLERLGFKPDQINFKMHKMAALEIIDNINQIPDIYIWFREIYRKNEDKKLYNKFILFRYLSKKLVSTLLQGCAKKYYV